MAGFDLGAIKASLVADISKFTGPLGKANSAVKKFTSISKGGITAAATSFLALAAAGKMVKDAVMGMVGATMEWIDAAAVQETLTLKLSQTLANIGEFSEEAVEGIQNMSAALQDLTGIDNEVIEETSVLLLNMNVPVDQLDDGVTAAINLSQALGIDLKQAAEQMGRTMGGTTGRLSQMLPELKELTKEELKNGAAIDLINKKYANFSEALQNSTGVQLKKISANFGDLKKSIGEAITQSPAFVAAMKFINTALKNGIEWINDNKEAFINWTKTVVVNVTAALATVVGIIGNVVTGFRLLTGTLREIKLTGLSNDLADVTDKINNFEFGVFNTAEKLAKLKAEQRELQKEYDALNAVQDAAAAAVHAWQQKVISAQDAITRFNDTVAELEGNVVLAGDAFENQTPTIEDNTAALEANNEAIKKRAEFMRQAALDHIAWVESETLMRAEIALASLAYLDINDRMVQYQVNLTAMVDVSESEAERLAAFLQKQGKAQVGFWKKMKADIGTFKQQAQKLGMGFISGSLGLWEDYWKKMGAGQRQSGDEMLAAAGGMIGGLASQFGEYMVLRGIVTIAEGGWPPNPVAIAAGGAMMAGGLALKALGGALQGAAGGGGGTSSAGTGGGGDFGPSEAVTDDVERQQDRVIQLNINGNLIGQEDYVRNELVPEINRLVQEADTVVLSTDTVAPGSQSVGRT